MIRFLIELLVRRTWFGQFDELYFVLNWLMMDCKLLPNLRQKRSRQQDPKCSQVKSSQYKLIIPHRVIQLTAIIIQGPREKAAPPTSQQIKKNPSEASEVPSDTVIHFYFYFFLIHRRALCSQPVRDKRRRTGRIFPEHVEWSFLDPEYSFVAVRRKSRTIFATKKFAQLIMIIKVVLKREIVSLETILHTHTHRGTRTHKHSDYTKQQTPGRLGMDKDARNRKRSRSTIWGK